MKIAALIIGIFGSMSGFIAAIIVIVAGGVFEAVGVGGAEIAGPGLWGMGMSVVGLVGAALALAKPRIAAGLMVVSAVGGAIAISLFYGPAAVMLLIAALLAFLGRKG